MPIVNRIAEFAPDMKAWRRHLHMHPELGLECHGTAAFVVEQLRSFGVTEIHEGLAERRRPPCAQTGRPHASLRCRGPMRAW